MNRFIFSPWFLYKYGVYILYGINRDFRMDNMAKTYLMWQKWHFSELMKFPVRGGYVPGLRSVSDKHSAAAANRA
jgi:hypothetical protein